MQQDTKVKRVAVRAIDIGHSNTKYTLGRKDSGNGNAIKTAMFTSIAPRVAKTQTINTTGAQRSSASIIGVGDADYWVGPGAASQAGGSEPRFVNDDYCLSPKYHALMLGALNEMAQEEGAGHELMIEQLVLGLPLTTYVRHADALRSRMTGEHRIGRAGESTLRQVTIKDVSVLVQPHGALMNLGTSRFAALSGLNLVVDAGGGTLDWFMTRGTEPNWAKSGAHAKGMLHCGLAVADGIKKSWRNQFEVMDTIDLALRTNAESFTVSGHDYPLAAHRADVEAVLAESVNSLLESTGDLDGVSRILFVGGGARLFHDYMKRAFPRLQRVMTIDSDPVFANLLGFHIAGEYQLRRAVAAR
ncbi:plasmid segregation protein ParM domain-containing protein [Ramlibacter sp. WS9]|uniref:ParM/StbA family protein n=1 Tax=Ramlibacter sp. WS9 TaxID=1882741 RepID=UPI001142A151|nr:plasmid segregation protein ParM domain-containing protein [Ramlibacter sp. WS9]ROZ74946.1 hypothetical protein EEB15_16315 [Ramlibacter sp. WS9]